MERRLRRPSTGPGALTGTLLGGWSAGCETAGCVRMARVVNLASSRVLPNCDKGRQGKAGSVRADGCDGGGEVA